jgi:hypothetical protein
VAGLARHRRNCTSKLGPFSRQRGCSTSRNPQLSDREEKSGHKSQTGARHQDTLFDSPSVATTTSTSWQRSPAREVLTPYTCTKQKQLTFARHFTILDAVRSIPTPQASEDLFHKPLRSAHRSTNHSTCLQPLIARFVTTLAVLIAIQVAELACSWLRELDVQRLDSGRPEMQCRTVRCYVPSPTPCCRFGIINLFVVFIKCERKARQWDKGYNQRLYKHARCSLRV